VNWAHLSTNKKSDYGWRHTQSAGWCALVCWVIPSYETHFWTITWKPDNYNRDFAYANGFFWLSWRLWHSHTTGFCCKWQCVLLAGEECWLDGCLGFELVQGQLRRLKAFVTWGKLCWQKVFTGDLLYNCGGWWLGDCALSFNCTLAFALPLRKVMENERHCNWKVVHTFYFGYLAAFWRTALDGLLVSSCFCLICQVTLGSPQSVYMLYMLDRHNSYYLLCSFIIPLLALTPGHHTVRIYQKNNH
jgi:hypothetical protein